MLAFSSAVSSWGLYIQGIHKVVIRTAAHCALNQTHHCCLKYLLPLCRTFRSKDQPFNVSADAHQFGQRIFHLKKRSLNGCSCTFIFYLEVRLLNEYLSVSVQQLMAWF
jgi:hypothetical protein